MENTFRQILYVSNTRRNTSDEELAEILAISRSNNAARGITGMLLYLDGAFLQVLEGYDGAVNETYEKIARDSRHWEKQVLLDRVAPRTFGEWSMGFERLKTPQGGAFAISSDSLNGKVNASALKDLPTLIDTFYRINSSRY